MAYDPLNDSDLFDEGTYTPTHLFKPMRLQNTKRRTLNHRPDFLSNSGLKLLMPVWLSRFCVQGRFCSRCCWCLLWFGCCAQSI